MCAICGQNLNGFGGPAQIGHLTAHNPVESNISHKDGHHHDIGHGPFPRLYYKEMYHLILHYFLIVKRIEIGANKFYRWKYNAECKNQYSNKNHLYGSVIHQDAHHICYAFALEEDDVVSENNFFTQQLEDQHIDSRLQFNHGCNNAPQQ